MNEAFESELVSVIIPAFNRAAMIGDALESVVRQTYRPIELIVVDDGSTDETPRVIEDWMAAYRDAARFHIRCFRQEHAGAPAARNLGLIESRGEFIQFLDSDDLLHPDGLSVKMDALTSAPDRVYAYGRSERVDEEGTTRGYYGRPWPEPGTEGPVMGYHFCTSGPLIRRGACVVIGPWNEQLAQDEIEYFARLKFAYGEGVFIDRVGETIRGHTGVRVSEKGAVRHAESAIMSIDLIGRMIRGTAHDTPAERRTISACCRAAADTGLFAKRPDLALEALKRSADYATGWNRAALRLYLLLCRIPPKGLLMRIFYGLRLMRTRWKVRRRGAER